MFRKHLSIRIDNPCSENWENMTPFERGRFCYSCSKQVIDFTAMKDAEIVAYFRKHSNVCGRLNEEQLDRNLLPYTRKQTLFGKAVAAVVLLFQTFLTEAQTQNAKPHAIIQESVRTNNHRVSECTKLIPGDSGAFKIKILVKDFETNQAIQDAIILINGDTVECKTGFYGWIEIELPIALKDSSINLNVFKKGYQHYQHETILDSKIIAISLNKMKVRAFVGLMTSETIIIESDPQSHSAKEFYRRNPGMFRDF